MDRIIKQLYYRDCRAFARVNEVFFFLLIFFLIFVFF
jgi:hypothetical protein